MQTPNFIQEGANVAKRWLGMGVDLERNDPIAVLTRQHREVESLFEEIENTGEKAYRTKQRLVEELLHKIRLHTELEEQLFYPAARSVDENMVMESLEEHHNVKDMLERLESIESDDASFHAKVCVLKELIEHHVAEEEDDLFPKCESAMDEETMSQLSEAMDAMTRGFEGRGGKSVKRHAANGHSHQSRSKPTRRRVAQSAKKRKSSRATKR